MATSEGNKEVAPADMPPNKGETQAVKVDMQPNDGETDSMDTDVETNNRETQSADVDMQPENMGTQPAEVDMQPENVEAQPAEVDRQPENIEAQPSEVDVQPENVEAGPAEVDMQPENVEAQAAEVVLQSENIEAEPAEVDMQPENVQAGSADVSMQLKNVEAHTADSKVQTTDEKSKVADDQTQPNNRQIQSADAQPINEEAQPINEETQPADARAYSGEKQPADDQSNNVETQPADGQPNNGGKQGMDDQSNNGKLQTADVQSKNGETQPTNVHTSNEETPPADAQPNTEEPQLADELNSGESQSAYAQSDIGETQPADGQPDSEEKQPGDVQPNSEETQPVDTGSNNGEIQPADAQPSNEEIRSADAETQSENAEKEPVDRKSQPNTESTDARTQSEDGEAKVDEKMHQSIGETQPTDAEMHLDDRDTQPINADMSLNDGETQPANLEMQPLDANLQLVNEKQQPNYGESHAPERLHPLQTEMQQSDIKTQSVNEDMQSNKGEPQPADADLQPNNGEIQPVEAHIRSDCGEVQTFVSDSQLKNEEIQSFYAEFQQNNGEMQPYNPEVHPYDVQIQPYNPEMQAHDGQIQPYEMQTQDGQIEPYNPETQPQDGQEQPYNPETQPNKRRKKKSVVWEHFTIENVSPGCRRALCNRCKQSFAYSTGSKVAGTSHLKRHIAKGTCAAPIQNQNGNQLSPYTPSSRMRGSISGTKRQYRSSSSPYVPFDQDRCRQEIAKMIIMHEYPLHMVEHPEFVSFVQHLQPRFDVGSFGTVQGDCIATYLTEKQNVMRLVEGIPGRVCISLDLWTSNQTVGYVVITGHFIDSDWKSNRRILNVVMEPYPESDTVLSHALSVCLSEWSVEGKIFSIIFNRQLNETGLENLRAYLAVKNPLVLNGQLLVGNCIGHTLGCMAKDLLGAGQDIVRKIRDSVKYVKTSDSHVEKFLELKRQLQVPSEKSLLLDDQTRWNTTYEMLLAASELKEVFSCLDTTDPDYKKAPSMEVWKQVETLCAYLKLLYDAANILTNTPNTTPITCFHEVWKIYSELGRAVSSEDPFIVHLTRSMHEKLIKYWKDCSLILAVAVVMDPRFKMKLVEFSFTKLYGEDAPTYVRLVDEGIHELFDEYVALPLPLTPTYAEDGHARDDMRTDEHGEMLLSDHGLTDFDMYIMETTSQHMKSEIDQYLEESLLPRVQEIDVLSWWKLNKLKYPTLSKMARDILTTPVCAVTSETIFNAIPTKMDAYRNTLRPVTVEALICAKDWLQYVPPEVSSTPLKMEF